MITVDYDTYTASSSRRATAQKWTPMHPPHKSVSVRRQTRTPWPETHFAQSARNCPSLHLYQGVVVDDGEAVVADDGEAVVVDGEAVRGGVGVVVVVADAGVVSPASPSPPPLPPLSLPIYASATGQHTRCISYHTTPDPHPHTPPHASARQRQTRRLFPRTKHRPSPSPST